PTHVSDRGAVRVAADGDRVELRTNGIAAQRVERRGSPIDDLGLRSPPGEVLGDDIAPMAVRLDQEDAFAGESITGHRRGSGASIDTQPNREGKDAALARLARDDDVAAHRLHEAAGDGEAEP